MQEQTKTLGRYFLEARESKGLKRQDLYALSEVKKIDIFDIEMSKIIPSKRAISNLCQALGLNEEQCFEMATLERENLLKSFYSSSFGSLIKNARKINGMTVEDVAYALEVHPGTLRRTESDETVPRNSLFESLVSLLDLDRKKALRLLNKGGRSRASKKSRKGKSVRNKASQVVDLQISPTLNNSQENPSPKKDLSLNESGKILAATLFSLKVSRESISEKLDIPMSKINAYFNGSETPTEDFVIRAAETFKFSPLLILEAIRKEWVSHFDKIKNKGRNDVLKTIPIYGIVLRSSRILNGLMVRDISKSIGYSHSYAAILEDATYPLKEDRIEDAANAWHVDPDVLRELWSRHASSQGATQMAGALRDKLPSLSAEAAREIFEVLKKHLGS